MNSRRDGIRHTWLRPLLYALPFGFVCCAVIGVWHGAFATFMIWLALVAALDA